MLISNYKLLCFGIEEVDKLRQFNVKKISKSTWCSMLPCMCMFAFHVGVPLQLWLCYLGYVCWGYGVFVWKCVGRQLFRVLSTKTNVLWVRYWLCSWSLLLLLLLLSCCRCPSIRSFFFRWIRLPPAKPRSPPPTAAATPATLNPANSPSGPPRTPPTNAPAIGRTASFERAAWG